MDYKRVAENIRGELRDYLRETGLKSLVIGISGGIDSTVCVALARPVCDELGVTLIGRSIPIETNKQDEIDRARMVGECFCHNFKEMNSLGKPYSVLEERIHLGEGVANDKIAKGNLKARLRMIYLYNLAGMNSGMVLGTSNRTEVLLDFYTIGGDGCADYEMIYDLWKTEVYGIASYLANEFEDDRAKEAIRACIEAKCTDGLGISESDVEQFGVDSYEEVDKILKDYIISKNITYENHTVIQRYKRRFKHKLPIKLFRNNIL